MRNEFELDLPKLLFFVKASCHENLHDSLVEVRAIIEKNNLPKKLTSFIRTFIQDLQRHLAEEENHLFPFIGKGRTNHSSIKGLVDDHDKMKVSLLSIRNMTNNYQIEFESNVEKSILYKKLKELDRIILNHIQIEDHILFPMIKKN